MDVIDDSKLLQPVAETTNDTNTVNVMNVPNMYVPFCTKYI